MLNQFYKYLSDKLISYLSQETLQGGERFYLQFDNEDQVKAFYDVLSQYEKTENFRYQHEQGSPYVTFSLQIPGEVPVIVAATTENVTPDFLVTLRNQVSEQKGIWKNTALLSICHETLDSIRGGSSDLQKEGMPFNVKSILKTLKEEIEKSSLNRDQREVLIFHLNKKLDEAFIQSSLWDYEEILGFLAQGTINPKDYPSLGLFYDEKLEQFTPNQMKKRLEENYALFEKVQHIHEYENLDNQLDNLFDDKGAQLLKKETWSELDYGTVKTSADNASKEDRALGYIESAKKLTNDGLIYWEKPHLETKSGQRKRHIIIFNPERERQVNLTLEFDDRLKKEFIHKKSESLCTVSGKKLQVTLPHTPNDTTLYQVIYTHNNQTKSKYEFNFSIVECNPEFLQHIQTLYEVSPKMKSIVIKKKEEPIIFGDKAKGIEEVFVEEENQMLKEQDKAFEISSASSAWDDDKLFFRIQTNESYIPFAILEESTKIIPVTGNRIWKLKREHQENFQYDSDTNKLKQGTREFSAREEYKKYLLYEQEWIDKYLYFAQKGISGLVDSTISIPSDLEKAYIDLMNYYKVNQLIPSLAFFNDELTELSVSYVNEFVKQIVHIEENMILTEEIKNLFKLGTIVEDDKILFTSLHPLNVAYQLEIHKRLKNENIETHILDRLHPNNLLPYIYGPDKQLYRPVVQMDAPEWLIFESHEKVAIGESNAFLSNVIEEKLTQFVEHFPYLFLNHSKSPIQINIINISNDYELVRGLINFIKKQIDKKGPTEIVPIEVALYQEQYVISSFEKFSFIDNVEEFEETFNVKLETKKLDGADVLRFIRENVLYYKPLSQDEYGYAHISFYKMVSNDLPAKSSMEEIGTGLSLGGLLSSLSFLETSEDYRTGFGIKHSESQMNVLVIVAKYLNELASNLDSGGTNPYRKNETIVTRTANYDEAILNQLYDSSYWVTFIEPNVDLNFFQNTSRNLLVIHYSDQYSSSTQYDAITVTDKSDQYKLIIENYLSSKDIVTNPKQIETAIRSFNSLNGEWLLRIIGSKGQFSREKLSIISAIKYILCTLNHENIFWIPISLEEILRIAGAVRLTKSEGVFSAKNLNVKGMHSDDILLIGVEDRKDGLYVHYYPVEVKIGLNQESIIAKAKEQITKTAKLFSTQLAKQNEEGEYLFKNEFFRNFFVQLLMSNAEKLIENEIWPEKNYQYLEEFKDRLLSDNYQLSNHLQPFIGKGAVLSFKKDQSWRAVNLEDNILIVELTEEDGYSGVVTEIEELKNNIKLGKTDIKSDSLLANKYQFNKALTDAIEIDNNQNDTITELEKMVDTNDFDKPEDIDETNFTPVGDLKNIRVLLGTVEGSSKEIYWEYGHPELANRHLLISGKSGQGKSYFIQCLLLELSRKGISNIIFDYTDGFKNSKLEPQFKEQLGDNLEQFLVARDKFPINPFKRNQKELDEGVYIDEDNIDIAERIKGVFSSVFKDLGIQQQNAIYEAVLRGLEKYGDSMNLELMLEELDGETGPAKTARSQIKPLIDKNPFSSEAEYNWSELLSKKGKVFIVQLTGYSREVQMMITEFILWDLWNYQLNHGDKNKPLPVILDEAQNLDHRESSPSAKILTEGRKFGWSGWYATQSFRGQFTIDEISRLQGSSQKIYFMPPENEISAIAANLSQDNHARKEWERKLSTLKKGQCIVAGPILQPDGTLKQNNPVLINISSLDARLK